jgi:hypothetical protein
LGVVKLFNITQYWLILIGDKIDGNTFATESTTPTDAEKESREINICIVSLKLNLPMNVIFTIVRQIVIDDKTDLLNVDPTCY